MDRKKQYHANTNQNKAGLGKFNKFEKMVLWKLGIYTQKNEVEPYTIYKNELKID